MLIPRRKPPTADPTDWGKAGPTYHFAPGVGHHAALLRKIAESFHLEAVIVTEGARA